MAWETRGRGGQYYTRSKRVGGKVKREYVGSGPMARIEASLDSLDRQRRETQREADREARQADEEGLRRTRWFCRAVENVLREHLTAAGFHQHDRGQWRKRRADERGGKADMATEIQQQAQAELERRGDARKASSRSLVGAEAAGAEAIRATAVPATRAEREKILQAAMNGDKKQEASALACIRAFPSEAVLGWGNPMHPCLKMITLREDTPRARVFREQVEQEYALKLNQVAGDDPTPLERLLAERITVLRFQITHFERTYECALEKGLTALVSEHHLKRIERLHKQYVRAIESLAKVRRLQLPTVTVGQLNVGDKQINVAG